MKILSFILPHIVANKAKGRIQKGCLKKKQSTLNFPENKHFLPPYTHTIFILPENVRKPSGFLTFSGSIKIVRVSEGKKCSFFRKFGVLYFLETPVLKFTHYLITDDIMPMFHLYTSWKRRETRVLLTFSGSIKMNVKWVEVSSILWLFHDGGRYHIETSPLICGANHWTGFYMITASVMKELNSNNLIRRNIFEKWLLWSFDWSSLSIYFFSLLWEVELPYSKLVYPQVDQESWLIENHLECRREVKMFSCWIHPQIFTRGLRWIVLASKLLLISFYWQDNIQIWHHYVRIFFVTFHLLKDFQNSLNQITISLNCIGFFLKKLLKNDGFMRSVS